MSADQVHFLQRNVANFTAQRKLPLATMHALVRKQFADAEPVLLTSSPVQGLATARSDIDLICLTGTPQPRERMATQIHHEGHHLEVVAFEVHEATIAFAALSDLAKLAPAEIVAGLTRWDNEYQVRRKYLERIISGVDMTLDIPFAALRPPLERVWTVASYDAFRQCTSFLLLSQRSGDHRAAVGYAANALLFLMDATLSACGWAYSNKKWVLRRWRMARDTVARADLGSWPDQLDGLWRAVRQAFGKPIPQSLADEVLALLPPVRAAFGFSSVTASAHARSPEVDVKPFLRGSFFAITPANNAVLLREAPDPGWNGAEPENFADLSPVRARVALQAARTGIVDLSLAALARKIPEAAE